jgi:pyrrolysine biosynthesis protein PylC
LRRISLQIARALELTGIMDVEVIVDDGLCKVLEIDARLPSQTPTAVFKSTGVNMVAMLYAVLAAGQLPEKVDLTPKRAVVYEHVRVAGGTLEVMGEHIMATAGPLRLLEGFMGADEAITNYSPGRSEWVATLIITEKDPKTTWQKRCAVIEHMMRRHNLHSYVDRFPYQANCLEWWREAE